MRKWNIDCMAWWSCGRMNISPLGVWNFRPLSAACSFGVLASPPVFFKASTMAMPALMPPAVNMSGGALNCW